MKQNTRRNLHDYHGPLTIELVEGTPTHRVPTCATVSGNTVKVSDGCFWPSQGGIQFVEDGSNCFDWDCDQIKAIRDGEDNHLWPPR